MRRLGVTIIVLSGPGSRARQVHVPRSWGVWALLISLASAGLSLVAGRQARALFDPATAAQPALAAKGPALTVLRLPGAPPGPAEAEPSPAPPARLSPRPAVAGGPGQQVEAPVARRAPPEPAVDPWSRALAPAGELALFDVNASQALRLRPFRDDGMPDPSAFAQLKAFMRCRRSQHAQAVHPRLVALLTRLSAHFGGAPLHIVSAHRTAGEQGTRPGSQHTRGTAADVRLPGVSVEALARAARELGAGGIGVYPNSHFVHLDVRNQPYYWRDTGDGPEAVRLPP